MEQAGLGSEVDSRGCRLRFELKILKLKIKKIVHSMEAF